jgi:hypothetical protein
VSGLRLPPPPKRPAAGVWPPRASCVHSGDRQQPPPKLLCVTNGRLLGLCGLVVAGLVPLAGIRAPCTATPPPSLSPPCCSVRLEHQIESEYRGALQQQCYNERMLQVWCAGVWGPCVCCVVRDGGSQLHGACHAMPCMYHLVGPACSLLPLGFRVLQQRYHYYGRREEAKRMELKSCDELTRRFGSRGAGAR